MDDTRGRILAVALREFASRGYDAVGVQEICAGAGITKPSLYHHYGSKRGLLEEINRAAGGKGGGGCSVQPATHRV